MFQKSWNWTLFGSSASFSDDCVTSQLLMSARADHCLSTQCFRLYGSLLLFKYVLSLFLTDAPSICAEQIEQAGSQKPKKQRESGQFLKLTMNTDRDKKLFTYKTYASLVEAQKARKEGKKNDKM